MKTLAFVKVFGVLLLVIIVLSPLAILAQGRNADEQKAWNLYKAYKQSKEKVHLLEIAIQRGNQDMRDVSYGFAGGFAIDPNDAASVARARREVAREQEKQRNTLEVWNRKFWGNYGDLNDCDKPIVDEKTKKTMDTIEFRLTYFPFKSGVASGYELFFDGKRVGFEPSWTMEQAAANLEGNIKNHPGTKVEGYYNGKPIAPPKSPKIVDVSGTWEILNAGTDSRNYVNVSTAGGQFKATCRYTAKGIPYSWTMTATMTPDGKVVGEQVHSAQPNPIPRVMQLSPDGKKFTGTFGTWVRP